MSVFFVNVVQELTSLVFAGGVLARGHWFTCDCLDSRRGQRIDVSRFLQGVR